MAVEHGEGSHDPRVETFRAADGYPLSVSTWPVSDGSPSRGRVVILHGVQSHAGWYRNLGKTLADAGFEAIFPDRRGSGANDRERGDAKSSDQLIQDVIELLGIIRERSKTAMPIALAGISWGGKIAVATTAKRPELVDALALLCPGLTPRVGVSRRERLSILLALLIQPRKRFPIPLADPALFTTNPERQRFIADDPLAVREATARLLAASFFLDRAVRRAPKQITMPTLLMLAGQDRIVDNELTRKYFERLATTDRQIVIYPEAHHTLEFEPNPSTHARDLADWLARTFQKIKR